MLTFGMLCGVSLVIGVPILVAALVVAYGLYHPDTGAGKLVYKYWPFGMPKEVQEAQAAGDKQAHTALREATRVVPMRERLTTATVGQFLTILGDRVDIAGRMLILELLFFGKDKSQKVHVAPGGRKLREFPWISLGDGRIIVQLPLGEGKSLALFIGENVTDTADTAISEFMAGTQVNPGPARRFADSNETANFTFVVPGITGQWRPMDIVWADCQVVGGTNIVEDGARVSMLFARGSSEGQYLLYSMLRGGQGNHSLWTLRPFNPDVEVEDIL